jgi:hypothetical protein
LRTFAFAVFARGEAAACTVAETGTALATLACLPLAWALNNGRHGRGFGEAGLVLLQTSIELRAGCGERRRKLLLRYFGQCAFHVELLLTRKWEGCELPGGGEAVDDLADAGARGERREEDFYLLAGGCDGGLQIERREDGERGALRLCAAQVELAAMARAEQLPVGTFRPVLSRHRHDAHGVPELRERAQHGGFRNLATEARP